ncbi:hypothetical protein [Chitinimonas koreensis]|uniref:hypothetical protein n=1 Tax=Chitinimonas koreensis TaxID=356302 RepID=UPI00042713C9|nr:hypothetical protein [Chitinimonas koreensis]QNM96328.1 hypothetical protein H9L41_21445 [Chitinimonas koreensis]
MKLRAMHPRLRLALLAALVGGLAGTALAWSGHAWAMQALRRVQRLNAEVAHAEARMAAAQPGPDASPAIRAAFDALVRHGAIGAERRSHWIAAFDRLGQDGRSAGLTTQVEPRVPAAANFLQTRPTGEELEAHANAFTLDARLLHEADLLALLDGIADQLPTGRLDQCRLQRSDGMAATPPYLLELHCRGRLFSFDRPAHAIGEAKP